MSVQVAVNSAAPSICEVSHFTMEHTTANVSPQELEKFKFVLDFKIKELKKQVGSREGSCGSFENSCLLRSCFTREVA